MYNINKRGDLIEKDSFVSVLCGTRNENFKWKEKNIGGHVTGHRCLTLPYMVHIAIGFDI